jgi:vancomycin resistance protein YoaR
VAVFFLISGPAPVVAGPRTHVGGAKHTQKKSIEPIFKVLSRFTTAFDPSNAKRAHNIRLAARRLNGKVIAPGQVLSVNRVVGNRTHENGFLTAPVIEDGKKVPGIGGGVSQVASTLFNAALLAGLTVSEHQNHTKPVRYLPVGRDATVAWNLIDLKIRNNTRTPVKVRAVAPGGRLTVAMLGTPVPHRKIGLAVAKKTIGPRHVETELYRIIKQGGKVVKKERIGRAEYTWKPEKPE